MIKTDNTTLADAAMMCSRRSFTFALFTETPLVCGKTCSFVCFKSIVFAQGYPTSFFLQIEVRVQATTTTLTISSFPFHFIRNWVWRIKAFVFRGQRHTRWAKTCRDVVEKDHYADIRDENVVEQRPSAVFHARSFFHFYVATPPFQNDESQTSEIGE